MRASFRGREGHVVVGSDSPPPPPQPGSGSSAPSSTATSKVRVHGRERRSGEPGQHFSVEPADLCGFGGGQAPARPSPPAMAQSVRALRPARHHRPMSTLPSRAPLPTSPPWVFPAPAPPPSSTLTLISRVPRPLHRRRARAAAQGQWLGPRSEDALSLAPLDGGHQLELLPPAPSRAT